MCAGIPMKNTATAAPTPTTQNKHGFAGSPNNTIQTENNVIEEMRDKQKRVTDRIL